MGSHDDVSANAPDGGLGRSSQGAIVPRHRQVEGRRQPATGAKQHADAGCTTRAGVSGGQPRLHSDAAPADRIRHSTQFARRFRAGGECRSGSERTGAADCLRQCRQPAAGARGRQAEGNGSARGARRGARAFDRTTAYGERVTVDSRCRGGPGAGALGARRAVDLPAALDAERGCRSRVRRPGVGLYAADCPARHAGLRVGAGLERHAYQSGDRVERTPQPVDARGTSRECTQLAGDGAGGAVRGGAYGRRPVPAQPAQRAGGRPWIRRRAHGHRRAKRKDARFHRRGGAAVLCASIGAHRKLAGSGRRDPGLQRSV